MIEVAVEVQEARCAIGRELGDRSIRRWLDEDDGRELASRRTDGTAREVKPWNAMVVEARWNSAKLAEQFWPASRPRSF